MSSSSSTTNPNTKSPSQNDNTLSSVVSNLVRASMGTSLSPTVTDEDLDRHVAELILREAKKKAEKYSQQGIRAYIASNLQDSNAPRTNKRFLSSIIRSTDDHNKAILRAQAQAAEEIKQARREEEKRERRARAEEAVRARKGGNSRHSRASSSHSHSRSWREEREGETEDGWDRWNGRTADREKERRKRKLRSWESWDGKSASGSEGEGERRKRRSQEKRDGREQERSRSREKTAQRRDGEDTDDGHKGEEDQRRRRRRDRSSSPRRRKDVNEDRHRERRRRSQSPSRKDSSGRRRRSSSRHHRRRSRSPRTVGDNKKEMKYALDDLREENDRRDDMGTREAELRRKLKSSATTKADDLPTEKSSSHTPTHRDRARGRSQNGGRSESQSHRTHSVGPTPPRNKLGIPMPPSRSSSHTRSMSPSSSSSSPLLGPPPPPPNLPSKMDKYFEEHYDPRLDVAPLSATPNVPATGLINDAEFEGWDAMLELIRLRKQDREDKKALERLGLLDKKDKKGKGKEKEKSSIISASGSSLMDIEYTKRGAVREWDLGKDGVDLSF